MSCLDTGPSACPCGTVSFPLAICNPPGLPTLPYRIGDFVAFRHRLLQALPGETELAVWRPGAEGDLGVQMMEWWAYVADILTFYNERIANEAYLGTATLPESVNHLVQLLGYRPRPALGSRATLAALLSPSARLPVTLPAGMQVQSKPGPGKPPQIFELSAQTTLTAPDLILADTVPASSPLLGTSADGSAFLWLAGKVSGIKPADRLLLINRWALTKQTLQDYAWIAVDSTAAQSDPLGTPVTQLNFSTLSGSIAGNAQAGDYTILRSVQSSPPWSYPTTSTVIGANGIDLAGIARGLTPGSLLLLDVSAASTHAPSRTALLAASVTAGAEAVAAALLSDNTLVESASTAITAAFVPTVLIVQSYAEIVWYANCGATEPAIEPPTSSPPGAVPAIGIPHAHIAFANLDTPKVWDANARHVTVRWGWSPVGQPTAVLTASDLTYLGGDTALVPSPGASAFPLVPSPVLLEDTFLNAASAIATPAAHPAGAITLTFGQPSSLPAPGLASPISVLFNLLQVTRGQRVSAEVLGSGNPVVAGQDFTLSQSPVTYFADPASISGDGFSSTVTVTVNGVQWQEQESFYGQLPTAQVFVLREDDQAQTHVTFGDGVNGALLPTGTNNIVATYRTGAGAAAPASETLTVVITPQPGLKGVRNPLAPTGGNDADSPAKLSTLAPQSVLTFNRAVSLDDYAAIAATAAGVTQVAAEFAFDATAQRPMVTLWIAGDAGAVTAVRAAIAGTAIPNQPLNVQAAQAVPSVLSLTYVRDPTYADAAVQAGLTTALVDPAAGLLGAALVGIGQTLYDSQIAQTCLSVKGVLAIHTVSLTPASPAPTRVASAQPASSGATLNLASLSTGRFPRLPIREISGFAVKFNGSRLSRLSGRAAMFGCPGSAYSPGAGAYFSVPNDGQHLVLSGTIPS